MLFMLYKKMYRHRTGRDSDTCAGSSTRYLETVLKRHFDALGAFKIHLGKIDIFFKN